MSYADKALRMSALAVLLSLAAGFGLSADLGSLIKSVFPVPSTTGNERLLALKIREGLPEGVTIEEDGLGGFAVLVGRGGPRTMILAPLDGYGYFVSGFDVEGYLRLDRPVPPPHARFDAYLMGQPVVISTAAGPLAAVVSQPSLHLLTQERRRSLVEGFSLDDAYVDIGARSEKEARARGVEMLDAVTFMPDLTELAGRRWAGTSLGGKTCCALLAALVEATSRGGLRGETVFVWAAQTKFPVRGRGPRVSLGALRAKNRWQPGRTIILEPAGAEGGAEGPALGRGPILWQAKDAGTPFREKIEQAAAARRIPLQAGPGSGSPLLTPFAGQAAETVVAAVPVQFLDTPSEIIHLGDAEALLELLTVFLLSGGGR
jgi:putative aminopeptidase FrvX